MPSPKRTTAPAFQFYPSDFLSSPKVMDMTATERGIYITLLCVAWMQGGLPNDPAKLARWSKVPLKQFARIWPHNLESCFTLTANGRLINERLEAERKKQRAFREKQKAKADKRWDAKKEDAVAMPGQSRGNAAIGNALQSSNVLQTSVGTAPRPQPLTSRRRLDAALEYSDRFYVPQRAHRDLLGLHEPSFEPRLFQWYERVCDEWTRANRNPGADMIKFWKARHDEEWPADSGKPKDPGPVYRTHRATGTEGA